MKSVSCHNGDHDPCNEDRCECTCHDGEAVFEEYR